MIIFLDVQFCYYDFVSRKWNIGDLDNDSARYPIPDNSCITKLDPRRKEGTNLEDRISLIVSGGVIN